MTIYTFDGEAAGDTYQEVLRVALVFCTRASLIVQDVHHLRPSAHDLLKQLEPHGHEVQESAEWPGTTLLAGRTAFVHYFEYNPASMMILSDAVHSLFDWLEPDLPEDLCLYRPSGTPWLVSISHEGDTFLHLADGEREYLTQLAPRMSALLPVTA